MTEEEEQRFYSVIDAKMRAEGAARLWRYATLFLLLVLSVMVVRHFGWF